MAFKPMPKPAHPDLTYASGNIVDDKAVVLVNTVNTRLSPFGRGIMARA